MRLTWPITAIMLMLQYTLVAATSFSEEVEPGPEFWNPCSDGDLRCLKRDAVIFDWCPSPVTLSRIALASGGEANWYASSRNGGGYAGLDEITKGLFASAHIDIHIALDMYAEWAVEEINLCEFNAFVRCHLFLNPGQTIPDGDASSCRRWAVAYGGGNRKDEIGDCASENGVRVFRIPNGVGECKWVPPDRQQDGSFKETAYDFVP